MFRTTVKACYGVSSVYVEEQSQLFFCHAPEKWGGGTRTPRPPECYAYDYLANCFIAPATATAGRAAATPGEQTCKRVSGCDGYALLFLFVGGGCGGGGFGDCVLPVPGGLRCRLLWTRLFHVLSAAG